MHLSSHSVGSHHGIIAKHSLFVLKIPSVHVTVKVSQWKNTNNKLSLFSFIFLFLNLQVERMASFTLPSLSALRHLQPSYGLTPRAVEATLVYTVLTASWRPDVDPLSELIILCRQLFASHNNESSVSVKLCHLLQYWIIVRPQL